MTLRPTMDLICARYDAFFIDIWGTLYEGGDLFPEALEFLKRLRQAGKQIFLVSNAPRRAHRVVQDLIAKGVTDAWYDHLITSGDDVHEFFTTNHARYTQLGYALYHIGRADQNLWEDTAFYPVDALDDASFILLTGVDHGTDFSEKYIQILSRARELNLPMVCANPDQFVSIHGQRIWCAGRLGSIYAQGGGAVFWHGKPIGMFFKKMIAKASPIHTSRMLMIGDGINTDIRGACYAGIDSLFLPSGMFGPQLSVTRHTPWDAMEDVHAWLASYPFQPTYIAPSLALWQP